MTTIDTNAPAAPVEGRVAAEAGALAGWLTTTDHKRLGRVLIGMSLLALLIGAVLATLLGVERVNADSNLFNTNALPQMFSLYRVGLTFGVLLPLMLGVGVAVVPLQIGAKSIAFPRLVAAGVWAWLFGLGLVIASISANGGPGGGNGRFVALYMASMILLVAGLVAIAASLVATILTTRAPGMNMRRIPLFSWSVLIASLGLVLALPVLAGTLIYLYLDYRYGRKAFGGNTGVMQWSGFGFTQPMTFLYALPVFGFLAETVATATRKRFPMRGTAFIGIGLVGVAALGAVTQNTADLRRDLIHRSFGTALNDILPWALFNLVPLLGGVVVLGVCGLALAKGRPSVSAPFVFALLGALMVLTGLAANVVDRIGDAQLSGTVFEEAVWIYVVYGGVLGALGAIVYWGPKLTGRLFPDKQALPLAALGFIATVLAALPYVIAGFAKQPAGTTEFDYGGPRQLWNAVSTVGHGLMALTVLACIALALRSLTSGEAATDDPWNGQTLEWATSSPAPEDNFPEVHIVMSPEPLIDLKPVTSGSNA
jgi:heme/copper-type cytochrome/quinol oxidase subunit 1